MRDEPRTTQPYEIDGADRPARWLVTCDHATNLVPDCVNGGDLGLPYWDWSVAEVQGEVMPALARELAKELDRLITAEPEAWHLRPGASYVISEPKTNSELFPTRQ